MPLKVTLNTKSFNQTLTQLSKNTRFTNQKLVRFWTKQLVRKAAYMTPRAPFGTSAKYAKTEYIYDKKKKRWFHVSMLNQQPWKKLITAKDRARAGWWPAAKMVGLTTVYAPNMPDRGEGKGIDLTKNPHNPKMIIENSVPYLRLIDPSLSWWKQSTKAVEAQMQSQLTTSYKALLSI